MPSYDRGISDQSVKRNIRRFNCNYSLFVDLQLFLLHFNIFFLYRCANILDVYLSFVFVCAVSLTLVSDPTSRRFIRWLLFQTFIYIYIESPSVTRGLRYFSTQESSIKNFNHKPSGEWLKFLILLSRVDKYRNPHGQLKNNLFLPLYNTNFISKSDSITDLTTCGGRNETF